MRHTFILVLGIWLAACTRDPEPGTDDRAPVATEHWLVTIELPDVALPVPLHLAADGSAAWFSNGAERVEVPQIRRQDHGWILRFPTFNNTVVLRETADGFAGSLTLVKRGYEQVMGLSAVRNPGYRFMADPQPAVDLTGRWAVRFFEDDGAESIAIGEFDQQGPTITGTFLTPKGDYRYLAGEVHENTMYLSTFDGAHAFVFIAGVQADGSLAGDFWSGTRWHESWTATRDFDARLPDAYQLTFLREGYERLAFEFPDLQGRRVSLGDEKYRDKVVLVTLAGTWCPNCGDEAAFLAPYYRANRHRGLEIITLLYEHFEDFETAARQGRAMQQQYGIEFDMLVAGSSDKTRAAETLPMLNHVLAFPTIIFIDRQGDVRRIHTGFSGPGTGPHYAQFKSEFTALMDELLAEPVPEVR